MHKILFQLISCIFFFICSHYLTKFSVSQRICETQGTCYRCDQNLYSFYPCKFNSDCFFEEHCNTDGFCCPLTIIPVQIYEHGHRRDNSEYQKKCKIDSDCVYYEEICVDEKCCPYLGNELQRQQKLENQVLLNQQGHNNNVEIKNENQKQNDYQDFFQYAQHETCQDPLKEYKICGSSCPISCATRNSPLCPQNECQQGCFCKLPYIIYDATDLINSKCVLPANCPLLSFTSDSEWNSVHVPLIFKTQSNNDFYEKQFRKNMRSDLAISSLILSTLTPITPINKCLDPLKNFLTCGTACPAGCDQLIPDCTNQCVSGCFCRAPYVLSDSTNVNSPCVLTHHCPNFQTQTKCNAKYNKIWSTCVSKSRCYRSCEQLAASALSSTSIAAMHLAAICNAIDECVPGCDCRQPYIWLNFECVLPTECPLFLNQFKEDINNNTLKKFLLFNKKKKLKSITKSVENYNTIENINNNCDASENKEYKKCATSCPLGCDNLELQLCTPCVSGCFCKNGFVFENSTDWQNSRCILIKNCPLENLSLKFQESSQQLDQKNFLINRNDILNDGQIINDFKLMSPFLNNCLATFQNINSKSCSNDFECGFQQKCCSYNLNSNNFNATVENDFLFSTLVRKCTCVDPNAHWLECGPFCPDFCVHSKEQINRKKCPQICRSGCFCNNNYIKSTHDPASLCIPVSQCQFNLTSKKQYNKFHISNNEYINLQNKSIICDEVTASAIIYAQNGLRIGQLKAQPNRKIISNKSYSNQIIEITGNLQLSILNFSNFELNKNVTYFMSIHQFSDTTINGCKNVGKSILLQLIEEDANGFIVTTTTTNVKIGTVAFQSNILSKTIPIQFTVLWPDTIIPGTNPLVGHSIVIKTFENEDSKFQKDFTFSINEPLIQNKKFLIERLNACAVLGIVPSCL